MDDIVILEWTFTPSDYFEEVFRVEDDNFTIVIDDGRIEARIKPIAYDNEHKMRDKLHEIVNDLFLGVQLYSHKPYILSKSSMSRLHPDGRRDVTLFPESAVMEMFVGTVDIVVKDRDGNILSDSRRERIEKKKALARLVAEHRKKDEFLDSMLGFYEASIHDPNNELIHLFDVWEALVKRFGDEKAVKTTLAISDSERRRLGRLANDEPLHQGRHRGKKIGDLRDATKTELDEARTIARKWIEVYLRFLEGLKNP